MRAQHPNTPGDGHRCKPGEWSDAYGCCFRTRSRCGRVLTVVGRRLASEHSAGLAAAGIKRRPLAPGESYAKGLPAVDWPAMPGDEAA